MIRNKQTPEELCRQEIMLIDEEVRELEKKIAATIQIKSDCWNAAVNIKVDQNPSSEEAKEQARKDRERRERLLGEMHQEEAKLDHLKKALKALKAPSAAIHKKLAEEEEAEDEESPEPGNYSNSGPSADSGTVSGGSAALLTGSGRRENGFTGAVGREESFTGFSSADGGDSKMSTGW